MCQNQLCTINLYHGATIYIYIVDKAMVIQFVRYCHSCLQLAILIKMSNNNPSQNSAVLDSSAKPSLGCQTFDFLEEYSRTTDSEMCMN